MKISVAMATYNGETYIAEQIKSILAQTIPVDEIIISDDGSSDRTLQIITDLGDPRIKIITGNPNPGYAGNFEFAICHTTGDIVFLADQDDIWMPNKVEAVRNVFCQNDSIQLVITDGILIGKDSRPIDGVVSRTVRQESDRMLQQDYLSLLIPVCLANGMCMAFRKKFIDCICPFPDSTAHHDRWIAFCGVCNDAAYFLNEPLVGYRIHDTNTSMRGNISAQKRFFRALRMAYNAPFDLYNMECRMMEQLLATPNVDKKAVSVCSQQICSHRAQVDALCSSPIRGAWKLMSLRRSDSVYRTEGKKCFFFQLFLVTMYRSYIAKSKRRIYEKEKIHPNFDR